MQGFPSRTGLAGGARGLTGLAGGVGGSRAVLGAGPTSRVVLGRTGFAVVSGAGLAGGVGGGGEGGRQTGLAGGVGGVPCTRAGGLGPEPMLFTERQHVRWILRDEWEFDEQWAQ